jgi:hypothetical protein
MNQRATQELAWYFLAGDYEATSEVTDAGRPFREGEDSKYSKGWLQATTKHRAIRNALIRVSESNYRVLAAFFDPCVLRFARHRFAALEGFDLASVAVRTAVFRDAFASASKDGDYVGRATVLDRWVESYYKIDANGEEVPANQEELSAWLSVDGWEAFALSLSQKNKIFRDSSAEAKRLVVEAVKDYARVRGFTGGPDGGSLLATEAA